MIGLINGKIGPDITLFKEANAFLHCVVLDDSGVPRDITTDTVEAILYRSRSRDGQADPVLEATGDVVTGAAGYFTVSVDAADMIMDAGIYYLYLRATAGTDVFYGLTPAKVTIT